MPNVYLASDHAGYALKSALILYIGTLGYQVADVGPHALDPEDDYPDFITPCAKRVASDPGAFGIIIGKSGEGEAMCANRIEGVRAGVFYGGTIELITLMREHNDANILSLGAAFITEEEAKAAIALFLQTPFLHTEQHVRRLAKF